MLDISPLCAWYYLLLHYWLLLSAHTFIWCHYAIAYWYYIFLYSRRFDTLSYLFITLRRFWYFFIAADFLIIYCRYDIELSTYFHIHLCQPCRHYIDIHIFIISHIYIIDIITPLRHIVSFSCFHSHIHYITFYYYCFLYC